MFNEIPPLEPINSSHSYPAPSTKEVLACVVTVQNSCIGGGNVTFSHNNGNNTGVWSISGGGTYTVSGSVVTFTPTTAGCFTASYIQGVDCSDTQNFLVYPAEPVIITPSNRCNSALTIPSVPAVSGFTVQYNIDGAGFTGSQAPPVTPGCHSFTARYVNTLACGATSALSPSINGNCNQSNTVSAVIFPSAPVIIAPANTCASMFTLPTVPTILGFNIQYNLNGGAFSSSPSTTTAGCHTIAARYVTAVACGTTSANTPGTGACGTSNTVNVVIFPAAPAMATPLNTCNTTLAPITAVPNLSGQGFTAEYAVQAPGGSLSAYGTLAQANALLTNTKGCWTIKARYKLTSSCGSTSANSISTNIACQERTVNAVVFPTAPIITATANTCVSMFTLPTVTDMAGFNVEYNIDGGAFSSSPSTTTPGCHTISARYVLAAACGTIAAGTAGAGTCAASTVVRVVIFPAAPVMTTPANTCNASLAGIIAVTNLTAQGFTAQYAVQPPGGSLSAYGTLAQANALLTNAKGCWTIKARYRLSASCGSTPANSISPILECQEGTTYAVVFPTAPVITAPINTCESMFVLPTVTALAGFIVEYSIDGGVFSATPTTTTPGCHTIAARYVLAETCGNTPSGTAGAGSCGASNTVSVVIFPTAPILTPPANACNSALPAISAIPNLTTLGFTSEYAVQAPGGSLGSYGTLAQANALLTNTKGCWTIKARYKLTASCGSTPANSVSPIVACQEGTTNAVVFPAAPVITAPANTCATMFGFPTITAVPGFNVEHSIDGGPFSATPGSTTIPGCHIIKSRYVLAATCGSTVAGTVGTGTCGESNEVSVVIFPAAPMMTAPSNTCDSELADISPVIDLSALGFTAEYAVQSPGGVLSAYGTIVQGNNLLTNTPGCWTIKARYKITLNCGSTPANSTGSVACQEATTNAIVFPPAPVITTLANTCVAAFALPSVTPIPHFNIEYSLDGGAYSSSPSTTTIGCHTITARYVLAAACGSFPAGAFGTGSCGASNTVNAVIFPSAPVIAAPSNTCNTALAGITAVTDLTASGFTAEYAVQEPGGVLSAYSTLAEANALLTNIPGCWTIKARYKLTNNCGAIPANSISDVLACQDGTTNAFVFPPSPVITAPPNTCASAITLPFVAPIPGFNVEYNIDGGAFSLAPVISTPGCHTISARYVTNASCGAILNGTAGTGICGTSNVVGVVIFPTAPVIISPANSCLPNFNLPTVPPIAGFTVEYSINGAAFIASPILPGTAGCHTVQVQYVLSSACGNNLQGTAGSGSCGVSNMISVVQFPSVPVLIPTSNTCAEEFLLPTVADLTASGFSTHYSIDGGAYSQFPTIPTSHGCHTIQAQYFLTSACGITPAGATSTGTCGASNTVYVVIFPTAPVISVSATACAANFILPSVTAVVGFNVEYSIDGGPFMITPSNPAVGCHTIQVRYSLALACGTTPQGAAGPGLCNTSNTESVVIFPAAPPAPIVSAGCGPFTVTPPASISGFNIEYSFDDGVTWGPNNPPTADNCLGYKIKTRYVTASLCGMVPAGSVSTDSVCSESVSTTRAINQTAPVLSGVPPNINVDCTNVPSVPTVTAIDECNGLPLVVTFSSSVIAGSCAGNYILTRTWSATNACANTTIASQVITVTDVTGPVMTGVPSNITVDCSSVPTAATVTAADACSSIPLGVIFSSSTVPGTCVNRYTITRSWTATDGCGNTTNASQIIIVTDNNPPVMICPNTQTVTCEEDLPAAFSNLNQYLAAGGTVTDPCGYVPSSFALESEMYIGTTCPITVERVYRITDNCGNIGYCTHQVIISDNIPPQIFDIPPDVLFECQDCIQSFLNSGFEEPVLAGNWAYLNEDLVPGWNTTSTTNNIELQKSGKIDGVVSYSGNQHAELNADQVGDFYQEFCTVPTTILHISFAHHKRMASINTTNDIMEAFGGPNLGSLTSLGLFTATQTSGWTVHTIIYPIPSGQTSTIFLFRAVQGAPGNNTYGNLIDAVNVVTLFDATFIPYATDNCDGVAIASSEVRVDGACAGHYQLIRTYSAIDACGNETVESQTVTLGDFTPPVFSLDPADVTVTWCNIPPVPTITALDNCAGVVPVVFSEVAGSGCNYTITRNWTTVDACNNTAAISQTISVVPPAVPVTLNVPPASITISCSEAITFAPGNLLYSNNLAGSCLISGSMTPTISGTFNDCGGVLSVVWDTTLACGFSISTIQTVIVSPAPQAVFINPPPDITVSCDSAQNYTIDVLHYTNSFSGVCAISGDVTPVLSGSFDECGGIQYITWTFLDDCNRTIVHVQTITVDPAPMFAFINLPVDITLTCDSASNFVIDNLSYTNGKTGVCEISGDVPGTLTGNVDQCGGVGTITWTYTDSCSRMLTHVQLITIATEPLEAITPTSAIIACIDDRVIPAPPLVDDSCGNPLTPTGPVVSSIPVCDGTITYTWTYTDCAANFQEYVHTITVNVEPLLGITATSDIVDCYANIVMPIPPVVTNHCGMVITPTGPIETGSPLCGEVATYTWSYTDLCGSTAIYEHAISIVDDQPPMLTCQSLLIDGCDAVSAPAYSNITDFLNGGGLVSDNCLIDSASFQMINETSDNGNCTKIITRTYQVADFCGNTTICNQVITLVDQSPPVIICPATETVECHEDLSSSLSNLSQFLSAGGTVTDQCGYLVSSFVLVSEVLVSATCPEIIERTYEITDSCGNIASCVHTLIVSDVIPPQLSNIPPNETLLCQDCIQAFNNSDFELPAIGGSFAYVNEDLVPGWATTSSSNNVELHKSGLVNGVISYSGNQHVELAADQAGDLYQEFCTVPTTFLEISFAHHIGKDPANTTDDIMEVYIGATLGSLVLQGSFTATQISGWTLYNIIYAIPSGQSSTIILFRAVEGAPGDITNGNLIDAVNMVTLFDATFIPVATDNCAGVTVVPLEQKIDGGCPGHYQLIRNYVAVDACGNQTSGNQTVTVGDFLPPTFSADPPDTTVTWCTIPPIDSISAFDHCSGGVQISFSEVTGNGCNYIITRTWTAVDGCNNVGTMEQIITVVPPSTPVFLNVPPDTITISCAEVMTLAPGDLQYSNNESSMCLFQGSISPDIIGTINDCGGVLTIVWDTTLACGITFSHSQIVIVEPSLPASFINIPSDTIISCDSAQVLIPGELYYLNGETGACNISGNVPGILVNAFDSCGGSQTITWTFTDSCGRSISHVQTITIDLETFPAIPPTSEVIACEDSIVVIVPPIVNDNCNNPIIPTGPMISASPTCEGVITYTWTYTDCEGFSENYVHTVTIEFEPFAAILPTMDTAPCYANIVLPILPVIMDYCGEIIIPTGPVESGTATCEGVITYTWTYTDCEGNTQDYVHTVNIEYEIFATIPPTSDTTDCYANIILPAPPAVIDNCGVTISPTGPVETGIPTCEGIITYTWTYTDCEGNTQDYVHSLTIEYEPFAAVAPTTDTAECYASIILPALPLVSDNCGVAIIPIGPMETGIASCEGVVTYTWTYTDCEANTQDYIHTVTIEYEPFATIAPTTDVADCYANIVLPVTPTVTDNCGNALTPSGPVETGAAACEGMITYTWTYTDCEGNTQDYVHTVTIEYEAFAAIAPTTDIADCYANIALPVPPTVTDNCGNAITPSGPVETGIAICEGVITYTWNYTDCEGNTQDYIHTVTIEYEPFGAIAPTTDVTDCYANIVLPTPPTITDNCGTALTPIGPIETGTSICEGVITYTWTYTDCEGNTQDYVHSVTIEYESFAPIVQTTEIADCYANIVLPPPPTITDNCGTALTPSGPVETGSAVCEGIITYTWTYIDCEGNSQDYVHSVTIEYEPLAAIVPTMDVSDCYANIILPVPPVILDNCGTALTPSGPVESGTAICEGVVIYTWAYTDCEGNTQDYVHTVTIEYEPFPAITPTTDIADCYSNIIIPTPPTITDNCGIGLIPIGPIETGTAVCEGVVIYTWTYIDCIGNTQDFVHTVTLEYEPFDIITPTTEIVDCYANIVLPVPPTITDNCGEALIPSGPVETGIAVCEGIITYTWTYTDCEGNTQDYVHEATIEYELFAAIAPTSDVTDCYGNIVLPAPPSVTDHCGNQLTPAGPVESMSLPCEGEITYTWTYIDCEGNTQDYVHTLTIEHEVFTPIAPTTGNVNCYADIILPTPPTVFDNCGAILTPIGPVESEILICEGFITYTWSYTDCEGNTQDYVHTVTIAYEPLATILPTTDIVDCYTNIVLPALPAILDNCGVKLIPTGPIESASVECEGDLNYIWTYTDCAGSSEDYVHTVTIEYEPFDPIPFTSDVVACYANIVLPTTPTVTDNCGVPITPSDPIESESVTCEGEITYTWTYTDCEGNTEDYIHTVTIEYEPFIAIPPTMDIVECYANIILPALPIVIDNCGVNLTPTGPVESGTVECEGDITYTWTYTDCEGNRQDYVHTVTIEYEPFPVIEPTTDIADCYVNIIQPIPPTITDHCGVILTPSGPVVSGTALCNGTITYTWIYTDCIGNTQEYVHTVTIQYEPFAVISPTTDTVECYASIVLPSPPIVLDNCGVLLTSIGPVEGASVACEGDISYTWTYTDCEGNSENYVHTVTIEVEPFAAIPSTTDSADCYTNIVLPTPPTITDNCGTTLTPSGPVETGTATCEGVITSTWTFTDCEGNTQDYVHTVTIEYEPFAAIAPTTDEADCYANIVLPAPPTIIDNCGTALIPSGPVETGAAACEGIITYTWTFTDCEGNTQDYVHTVTVEYEPFAAIAPTTDVADCYANIVLPVPPSITDNCGTSLTPSGPAETGTAVCEGVITYTWTYTDCEGNTQDYVHTVNVEYEPFAAIAPTSDVADCYANIVLPTPPSVTDNCGTSLTPSGPLETGSAVCEGVITYTWTYTDCEGNTQDYVHTVTIEYDPFAAIAPTTDVADCYANIVLPAPPSVTDNCGTALIPSGPVETGTAICEGEITYTWTYTDCEGNTQDYVHTVTIEYEPFTAIAPTTDIAGCYANIVLPAPPVVNDNCGTTLTPTGPVETGTAICEGVITYTWTYTDCEGNTQDYVHTVTIEYEPFAAISPTTDIADCYANIVLPTPPSITDNCGTALTPNGPVETGSAVCEGVITYTWTYTDCEGNTQDYVHTVTVEYEPFSAIAPTTDVADCYANIVLPVPPIITDNCGNTITSSSPIETGSAICEGVITYTWTYTDCKGNTQDYVHTVTIEYEPFASILSTTDVADCYANIVLPVPPTVTDNCGAALIPSDPVETGTAACEGIITYTWTYTDCEGNTQDYVHTVTIEYEPFAAIAPTTDVADCYANIVLPTPPSISDNCGTALLPSGPVETGTATCDGEITYTWTYTDCEGNTQDYVHTVTIEYEPFAAIAPTTDIADCYGNIVLPVPPIVTDNCGIALTPSSPVETGAATCEGVITYTWTYTDCEGNTQDYVHTVTIEYEPFAAIAPTTDVADCYANIVLPAPPSVIDNCGTLLTPTGPVETGTATCEGEITYTWTYTDCEGNTQDYVHIVTIEYEPFAAIAPTTDIADCYANIVLPTPPSITDNCGTAQLASGPVETGTATCEGEITYTWTYTDCEGNTQDYVHTVTVEYEPFAAIAPTTDIADCYANIVLPVPPTVTDNCGFAITPTGPVETGTAICEGVITYTWTYTDCEGNTQDYVHTVSIEYEPFVAIPPTTDIADCYANIVLPTPPSVTDNCGTALTPTGAVETGTAVCEGVITYTWTYIDCEGNTQDYVHTVTIEYEPFAAIAPTTDLTDCYANIVLPAPPVVTDNCGTLLTPSGPVETGTAACEGEITYT